MTDTIKSAGQAISVALFVAVAGKPATAIAQDRCDQYVGQTISPLSFDAAAVRLRGFRPRGQFESTPEFQARIAAEFPDASRPLIISKEPENRAFFEYDADAQRLRISSLAFDLTGFDAWSAFFSARTTSLRASPLGNIDVVISETDRMTGSYWATNAFGVRARVSNVQRVVRAIFDREKTGEEGLFVRPIVGNFVSELPMTAGEARAAIPTLKLAIVVRPRPPFVVAGTRNLAGPTLDRPHSVRETFTVLVGDIQCGLVTDRTHRVLTAVATN
jgi:hypothetical protein